MSCDLKLEYLLRDRPYDPAVAPADYDMLCVKSGGAELYGEILWPDGGFQGPRPCVLLCHGYPGVARNDDLAAALRRIGCVVAVMHHRGAWGSQGKYLVSNCVEDVAALAVYMRSPAFCEAYHTDPDALFLIGHSMGGSGTWSIALAYPEVFARIAPLSGAFRSRDAAVLKDTPVRAFVGAADTIVPPESSQNAVAMLARLGDDAQITTFAGADHFDVPALTYLDDSIGLLSWLIGED